MKCYKRLDYKKRILIENLLKNNTPKSDISIQLGISLSALYYEINKGLYTRLNGKTYEYYTTYSADIAEQKTKYNLSNKGTQIKLGNNYKLAEFIETKILNGYSPDVVAYMVNVNDDFDITLCAKTIYNWIDKGIFLNISNKNLLYKKKKKNKKYTVNREKKKCLNNRSIEERPKIINKRNIFGHWEMDTVISKSKGNNECLLVLTERFSRYEIIRKISGKNQSAVALELFKIENQLKSKFSKVFKTITVDNGCEFLNQTLLEKSRCRKQNKTTLFYCHPYCASERGSNEKQNQIIRRFIPKGVKFEKYTNKQIKHIQNWINTLPRKVLGYKTSYELFLDCVSSLKLNMNKL